ncbi:sialic acid synthase isoform X1 [Anabrus simplex]|uniref:sialic acid synthase isoform X1 n=1 Tax=Anabrus simplex TaxID=316456 RepID=UPI0035A396B1
MPPDLQIAPGKVIGDAHPCFIIAEIGQNHQGDINIAKQLIRCAKESGADCVKFQKTCLTEKFNYKALQRPYSGPNSWGSTYGEHKAHLEFSDSQFYELQRYATEEVGIVFTASAMDLVSMELLLKMNVPFLKIGSGDAANFPMLEYAAATGKPLVISTGMQNLQNVQSIYQAVKEYAARFCFMHCVSSYPTPAEHVNLKVINLYKQVFPDIHVGYSGHEIGIPISVAAVALGAKLLERHITLDKSWKGTDHICSLTPGEFQELVNQVRLVEVALGEPVKQLQPSEHECYMKLGKTIVAARKMHVGMRLGPNDLKVKVADPKGCPADIIKNLIGMILTRNLEEDESILLTDIS